MGVVNRCSSADSSPLRCVLMRLKYRVACGMLGIVCTCTFIPLYIRYITPAPAPTGPLFVTAAHIPHEQVTGYKFIYEDTERDTAFYIKNDYKYHYPDIGETVYFQNGKGIVDSIKDGVGFYVVVDENTEVYKGLSGARVRDKDGNDIAFISSAKDRNKVLCVSIY